MADTAGRILPNPLCQLAQQPGGVKTIELSLAEEWLAPELISVLRDRNLRGTLPETDRRFVTDIKAQIVGYLVNGSFSTRRLAGIVNFIRKTLRHSLDTWLAKSGGRILTEFLYKLSQSLLPLPY